jgi:regulator of RNase E activity RraA
MDVAPGDLVQIEENGAVQFPPQHAEAVLKIARAMLDVEAHRLVQIRKARTAAEVRAANSGGAYTQKKP